jgi:hypothetical protein
MCPARSARTGTWRDSLARVFSGLVDACLEITDACTGTLMARRRSCAVSDQEDERAHPSPRAWPSSACSDRTRPAACCPCHEVIARPPNGRSPAFQLLTGRRGASRRARYKCRLRHQTSDIFVHKCHYGPRALPRMPWWRRRAGKFACTEARACHPRIRCLKSGYSRRSDLVQTPRRSSIMLQRKRPRIKLSQLSS